MGGGAGEGWITRPAVDRPDRARPRRRAPGMLWVLRPQHHEEPPRHALTGGRRGGTCPSQTGMDDLGDRPPPRPEPFDGPRLPDRCTYSWTAPAIRPGRLRALRAVRRRPVAPGPARVGQRLVRRDPGARLRPQLPALHPRAAGPLAATALRGLRGCPRPADQGDRASGWRGDAVGLAGAALAM